ncbi:hypothetical protein EIP91_002723 [Steccherinum ochraceum]|uniref:Uncharacterized protein n=1 Tax=Steccherinum ochraceum TaxID=92696 RepID=A0A4R0RBJ6_9APHY|nr:hypothetical protein EIP91_002723 [Steccherinum ochraceum]
MRFEVRLTAHAIHSGNTSRYKLEDSIEQMKVIVPFAQPQRHDPPTQRRGRLYALSRHRSFRNLQLLQGTPRSTLKDRKRADEVLVSTSGDLDMLFAVSRSLLCIPRYTSSPRSPLVVPYFPYLPD